MYSYIQKDNGIAISLRNSKILIYEQKSKIYEIILNLELNHKESKLNIYQKKYKANTDKDEESIDNIIIRSLKETVHKYFIKSKLKSKSKSRSKSYIGKKENNMVESKIKRNKSKIGTIQRYYQFQRL